MNLVAKSVTPALLRASAAVSVFAGGICSLAGPVFAFNPAYTTKDRLGAYYTASNYSSFGFFFDTTKDLFIDGLGFAPQQGWPGGNSSYTVSLWSFDNGGLLASDYTLRASSIFTPGNLYTIQAGYCWQSIALIPFPNTSYSVDPTDLKGYVIAAIGNFTNAPGNVQYETATPFVDPNFDLGGNGYGDSATADGFFPIPIQYKESVGYLGYFNPNLSYVPGPVPIIGAAGALGMARRLRRKVKISKSGKNQIAYN